MSNSTDNRDGVWIVVAAAALISSVAALFSSTRKQAPPPTPPPKPGKVVNKTVTVRPEPRYDADDFFFDVVASIMLVVVCLLALFGFLFLLDGALYGDDSPPPPSTYGVSRFYDLDDYEREREWLLRVYAAEPMPSTRWEDGKTVVLDAPWKLSEKEVVVPGDDFSAPVVDCVYAPAEGAERQTFQTKGGKREVPETITIPNATACADAIETYEWEGGYYTS